MRRHQQAKIVKDLAKKMVFLVGPRQVGKTWIAQKIASNFSSHIYLNHDNPTHKTLIENKEWLEDTELIILDELHKMPKWKNYLKGLYDTKPKHQKILVTGSARLDTFRQAGDSLAGRFFLHRLLPFSPSEVPQTYADNLNRFITRGGFPEPYLAENQTEADRWRAQYLNGLIRNDILDFENIHDLKAISNLVKLLRNRVGSPISYTSLAEDLNIAPNTVKKYIEILEALYIIFRVIPYANNIARSILKAPKLYFYDTGLITGDTGAKFENLIAICLLKHIFLENDYKGKDQKLHYIRTKDGKEVDFCITENDTPVQLIEAKVSNNNISSTLIKFQENLKIPTKQVIWKLKQGQKKAKIELHPATTFLKSL